MKNALTYAANMVKDYCGMKFRTMVYEGAELANYIDKYTKGCAVIAGTLLAASVGIAIVNSNSEA